MNNLTQDEIDQLVNDSTGKLNDHFCRMLVAYMAGYLRMSQGTDANARQIFFEQIKQALNSKTQTVKFL